MNRVRMVVLTVAALCLPVVLTGAPAHAEIPRSSVVKLGPYRIPDALLSRKVDDYYLGYGYPPAYGFDTADHNVQCYIAPSEDSSPYVCGVQMHAWSAKGKDCRKAVYTGVLGFANGSYGTEAPASTCAKHPLVPRERTPGSTATTGNQVNKVLRAGSTIRYLGVTCTSAGTGRNASISCVEVRTGHGFRVSSASVRTH